MAARLSSFKTRGFPAPPHDGCGIYPLKRPEPDFWSDMRRLLADCYETYGLARQFCSPFSSRQRCICSATIRARLTREDDAEMKQLG